MPMFSFRDVERLCGICFRFNVLLVNTLNRKIYFQRIQPNHCAQKLHFDSYYSERWIHRFQQVEYMFEDMWRVELKLALELAQILSQLTEGKGCSGLSQQIQPCNVHDCPGNNCR